MIMQMILYSKTKIMIEENELMRWRKIDIKRDNTTYNLQGDEMEEMVIARENWKREKVVNEIEEPVGERRR